MKARGKLVSLLMALVCLLPIGVGLLGFGDSASAATPKDVTVTLHKKKMDDFPKGLENDGEIDPDIENKYEGLPGVGFRPWDITEAFYEKLEAEGITGSEDKATYEAKVKEVMEGFKDTDFNGTTKAGNDKKQPVAGADAKVTGSDGTVSFTLPDRSADGVYRVYWFEETLPPEKSEQFSQLVILALPVLKVGTEVQSDDIHLYPKNKLPNKPEKVLLDENGDPDKTPGTGRVSFDIGKEIKYKVTYQIPIHIGDRIGEGATEQTRYSRLTFRDEVSHDGVRFEKFDSMKVIGGNPEDILGQVDSATSPFAVTQKFNHGADYAATGKKAGFEIAFKLDDKKGPAATQSILTANWLKDYAGKTLEIIYTVKLTEDTPIDADIKNKLYVDLQQSGLPEAEKQEPEETPPAIVTGGKKFVKHEKDKDDQTLKGAEFVITNKTGTQYLTGDANNYTWRNYVDDTYEDAIRITSGDNGLFEIKGLKYGDYQLVETKAPNGYVKGGPVDFVVDNGSYNVELGLRDKIANVSRGGFLPSTGGIGIAIFLIIGGSLMGFAVSRYRKQQHVA